MQNKQPIHCDTIGSGFHYGKCRHEQTHVCMICAPAVLIASSLCQCSRAIIDCWKSKQTHCPSSPWYVVKCLYNNQ